MQPGCLDGQSLNHPHASTTAWALMLLKGRAGPVIQIASRGAIRHVGSDQQLATLRELGSTMCIGQEAIVTDTTKTGRENM